MATWKNTTTVRTSERTERVRLPDGTVKMKTIIQKTGPDGRTVTEEMIQIEKPAASETPRPRFNMPNFFGKSNEKTQNASPLSFGDFRKELLRLHNEKRAKHGSCNLAISEKLNSHAQDWADHLAKVGSLQHRPRSEFGENIFMGYNSASHIPPSQVVESWYSEIKQYNYNQPSTACGHFTQMVWKSSKEVGFGYALAKDGKTYVVANYNPAGNMIGQFKENVGRLA